MAAHIKPEKIKAIKEARDQHDAQALTHVEELARQLKLSVATVSRIWHTGS